jgi:hypothetical protein
MIWARLDLGLGRTDGVTEVMPVDESLAVCVDDGRGAADKICLVAGKLLM